MKGMKRPSSRRRVRWSAQVVDCVLSVGVGAMLKEGGGEVRVGVEGSAALLTPVGGREFGC